MGYRVRSGCQDQKPVDSNVLTDNRPKARSGGKAIVTANVRFGSFVSVDRTTATSGLPR
jgi:hypothetical protein